MKFNDIVGQVDVKRTLVRAVDQNRISHAQLFSGMAGYGVLPLALAYAQYVNCGQRANGDSCGVCSSCIKIAKLEHPDLHFMFPVHSAKDGAKTVSDSFISQWRNIVISSGGYFDENQWYEAIDMGNRQGLITRNDADEVIRKLSFKPFENGYKIVVVWLPERMRTEAANALLKILEEPWDKTLFILVTQTPHTLLPTILSRTQQTEVPCIDIRDMSDHLTSKYSLSKEDAANISHISGGDLLEAHKILSERSEGISGDMLDMFMTLMRMSYNDKHLELLDLAETLSSLGREQQKLFLIDTVRLLRSSYMINAGLEQISHLWGSELDFCRKFSPFVGNHNIEQLVEQTSLASAQIGQNGNPKIVFTHYVLAVSKMIVRI